MLPNARQLARLLLAVTDKRFIERKAQATLVKAEAWLVAGVMLAVAAVFFMIAAFAGLAQVMPVWAAALVIGILAAGIAGVAVMVAKRRRQPPLPPLPDLDETTRRFAADPQEAAAAVLGPLLDEAVAATRDRPGETMMLAVAAGMLAGRLLNRPRK
jgi:hypothetical protein